MTLPLVQGWIGAGVDGGMELLLLVAVVMLAMAIFVERRRLMASKTAS